MHDSVRGFERREWVLDKDVWKTSSEIVVPYFVDADLALALEAETPHASLASRFPFDYARRSALLPFIVLCRERGYAGLDDVGFKTLSNACKSTSLNNFF